MDLGFLSLKELKELERDVAAAISSYKARTKAQALAELEAKAHEDGFTLSELTRTSVAAKAKRASAQAKYANADNHSETWSGRGRKPAWFTAALADGKSLTDLTAQWPKSDWASQSNLSKQQSSCGG